MQHNLNRLLSLLLVLAMVFSLTGLSAGALELEPQEEASPSDTLEPDSSPEDADPLPPEDPVLPEELTQAPTQEPTQTPTEEPTQAPAEEPTRTPTEENAPEEPATDEAPSLPDDGDEEEEYVSLPEEDRAPEEQLYDYLSWEAAQNLDSHVSDRSQYGVCDHMEGPIAALAKSLIPGLKSIAEGSRASAILEVTHNDFGLFSWSAEDLGLDTLVVEGTDTVTNEAKSIIKAKIDNQQLLSGLCTDLPYHLFWFNKTSKKVAGRSTPISAMGITKYVNAYEVNGQYRAYLRKVTVKFLVADEYAVSDTEYFTVDTAKCTAATVAADAAAGIVNAAADLNALEKLLYYKDAICARVSYNFSATNGASYGNPWQLIWVFDDDATTNVVCEGYSKAFQFLCDLSDLGQVQVRTVTGYLKKNNDANSAHMWNVVQMEDGLNYLADVTNCDTGMSGYPDRLFLAGASTGTVWEGYTVSGLPYYYRTINSMLYTDQELTLSPSSYVFYRLSDCTLSESNPDLVYNGQYQTPSFTLKRGNDLLLPGTDYSVHCTNNLNAGTASYTITGRGHYVGQMSGTFPISALDLADATVTAPAVTYTGSPQSPAVTVSNQGAVLPEGDYTLSFTPQKKAGTYTFTVSGKSPNCTGTATGSFTIQKASQNISVTGKPSLTAGESLTLRVKGNLAPVTFSSDNTTIATVNANGVVSARYPGTATIVVKAQDENHEAATVTHTIQVNPISLESAVVTLNPAARLTYTGSPVTPAFSVTCKGETLVRGRDFTTAWFNNVNAGTAMLTVTGRSKYTSSAKITFTIQKASQNIKVKVPSSTLTVGQSCAISVSGNRTSLTYTSSNPSVATVNSRGVVTGKKYGSVTITVQAAGSNYLTVTKQVPLNIRNPIPELTSLENQPNGMRLRWKRSAGAVCYRILCKAEGGNWKGVGYSTGTSFLATTSNGKTPLKSGVRYTFTVRCVAASGTTTFTSDYSRTGLSRVYAPGVSIRTLKSPKAGTVSLTWNTVSNISGYQVQYSEQQDFSSDVRQVSISGACRNVFTRSTLLSGKTYYFRLRTFVNVDGKRCPSAWSKVKSLTIR